jgi:hypothetical protein
MFVPNTPAPTSAAIEGPTTLPAASPLAVGVSDRFLQYDARELARRIVAGLDQPLQLAIGMGLTPEQWQVLEFHPHFMKLMGEARDEANSANGLVDQVRLKALMALNEGGVLDMASIMADPKTAPNIRKGAFDSLADVAGITRHKDQQASQAGAGPLITIIMPGGNASPRVIGPVVSEQ